MLESTGTTVPGVVPREKNKFFTFVNFSSTLHCICDAKKHPAVRKKLLKPFFLFH